MSNKQGIHKIILIIKYNIVKQIMPVKRTQKDKKKKYKGILEIKNIKEQMCENVQANLKVCNKAVMIRKGRKSDEMGQSFAFALFNRTQRPATQSDNATSAHGED